MDNTKIKIAMDDVDAPYIKEEYKLRLHSNVEISQCGWLTS